MADKKTLVLGATPDASRYAYLAANRLVKSGHSIVNVGIKIGEVAGVPIEKPENNELRKMANEKGIETEYACTLVLLSIGEY